MKKYVSLIIDFLMYEAKTPTNDPANALKLKNNLKYENLTEVNAFVPMVIPDASTDVSIPLPDSTNDILLITVTETVSVKLNGSSTALTLSPKASGVETIALMLKSSITGLTVTNASGKAASLKIIAIKI